MFIIAVCLILSIILPFFSCLYLTFFGRYLGHIGSYFLGCSCLFLSLVLWLGLGLIQTWQGVTIYLKSGTWLNNIVDWDFLLDIIGLQMMGLILTITFCAVLYSSEYMIEDPHSIRFVCLLLLFSVFMMVLISSNNLLQMFIGWEGVGLVSFMLINFWSVRLEANRAAIKAILFNRIGDTFFLLGLCLLLLKTQTLDILTIQNFFFNDLNIKFLLFGFSLSLADCVLICFFIAAMGKSAQIFLHAWLPDAMEGPTPVSSLLHSATMVTAGIFLMIRFSPIYINSTFSTVFILVGAFTAFFNALFGIFQHDVKKIIAFSTCSQLGIMLVGVMYNAPLGFYHLINHGFFKALLFLSAGSIIHALNGEQDIRKMGGLCNYIPYTLVCLLVGSFALVGFPFLSGFFSKEFILFMLFSLGDFFSSVIFFLLFFASIFTGIYSIKIIKNVFFLHGFNNHFISLKNIHESHFGMVVPMFFLTLLAICFGFLNEDLFNSLGNLNFENHVGFFQLIEVQLNLIFVRVEISDFVFKLSLIFFFFLLLFFSIFRTLSKNFIYFNFYKVGNIFFWIVSNKLGFISFYRKFSVSFFYLAYYIFFFILDRGVFELLGPTGVIRSVYFSKKEINKFFFVSFSKFFISLFFSILWLFFLSINNLLLLLFLSLLLFGVFKYFKFEVVLV